ncbi:MAG: EAL domain-containing protein [Acidobacteriota bacterium]|nr:EAL domain-containing protein [Acidobacteriota bacterium]
MSFCEWDLRESLERNELVPYFQPLVDLRSGDVFGFEVLARIERPGRDLILPGEFIAIAERTGLIDEITRQISVKAMQVLAGIPTPYTLSINISPHQLQSANLIGKIERLTRQTGFSPERLHIEITEGALIDNMAQAREVFAGLRKLGCKLAMDDFGTGYSSLHHLQGLPFNTLKVDRSFVSSMTRERESRKIVAAVLGLGHSLGLETLAEGVETDEQAEMLVQMGCDQGQGWLFGRPMPAHKLLELQSGTSTKGWSAKPKDSETQAGLDGMPAERLAQLRAIYDGSPIGLCYLDRKLRYVSINKCMAELDGMSITAHLGRTPKEVAPDYFAHMEPYLLRALNGEAISRVEVRQQAGSGHGKTSTMLVSLQPAFDEAGETVGVSMTALDVSPWNGALTTNSGCASCTCMANLGVEAPQSQITALLGKILQPKAESHAASLSNKVVTKPRHARKERIAVTR